MIKKKENRFICVNKLYIFHSVRINLPKCIIHASKKETSNYVNQLWVLHRTIY